jgi:hypothetical protein
MFSPTPNNIIPPLDTMERTIVMTGRLVGPIGYPITPHALLRDYPDTLKSEWARERRETGEIPPEVKLAEREVNLQAAMHQMAACWSVAGAKKQDLITHLSAAREPTSREFQMIFLWKNIRDMVSL